MVSTIGRPSSHQMKAPWKEEGEEAEVLAAAPELCLLTYSLVFLSLWTGIKPEVVLGFEPAAFQTGACTVGAPGSPAC